MRIRQFRKNGVTGIGFVTEGGVRGLFSDHDDYPGGLDLLIGQDIQAGLAVLHAAPVLDESELEWLPPITSPGKILCVGLNYADHTLEVAMEQPAFPTIFVRFSTSLMGHQAPCTIPHDSEQLDFEGEIAMVIGKTARNVSRSNAGDFIAGWVLFNDISVRDYQFKTSQWTIGKNFDSTGAFGPDFITADELPPYVDGLRLQTRLNGEIVQDASTSDMIFKPDELIEILSAVMTLQPGDVIVTGTPAGVGMARKPPLWMKAGDVVTVEVSGMGTLTTPIIGSAS
jgi:acylpyruvate hydrolase